MMVKLVRLVLTVCVSLLFNFLSKYSFKVALSSITWPSPGMAAIPPNELPLPLPAQNSLTFHSSPGNCPFARDMLDTLWILGLEGTYFIL